jgi:hypothetical protein
VESVDHVATVSDLSLSESLHFSCGVDKEGLVAPYASIVLRNRPAGDLVLRGAPLERLEVAEAEVTVWIDEVRVGRFVVGFEEPLHLTWPLPREIAGRDLVSVRLASTDYAYAGVDLQQCVVFRLESVAIEEPSDR